RVSDGHGAGRTPSAASADDVRSSGQADRIRRAASLATVGGPATLAVPAAPAPGGSAHRQGSRRPSRDSGGLSPRRYRARGIEGTATKHVTRRVSEPTTAH